MSKKMLRNYLKKSLKKILVLFSRLWLNVSGSVNKEDEVRKDNIDKILINAPYGGLGLGDFVLYLPTIRAIRKEFPDSHIAIFVEEGSLIEKLVRRLGAFDELILCEKGSNWQEKIHLLTKVNKHNFDLIVTEFHSHIILTALIALFSGAHYKLGHVSGEKIKIPYGFLYNLPVKVEGNKHYLERYSDLLKPLRVGNKPNLHPSLDLYASHRNNVLQNKIDFDIDKNEYISIAPGSGSQPFKRWSPKKFALLIEKIKTHYSKNIVLLGGKSEVGLGREISESSSFPVVNKIGKLSLWESTNILSNSLFLVSNDSGLMHLSEAVNTPVIAIIGPTDPNITGPLMEDSNIIRADDVGCAPCYGVGQTVEKAKGCENRNCLEAIATKDVFNEVKNWLD